MLAKITAFFSNLGEIALTRLLPAAAIVVLGLLVSKLLLVILGKALEKTRLEPAAVSLLRSVLRVVLCLLVGLMAASALGIDVTGIVALASVLTLAVSLSVQDALTNLIGGFTLLYTKPFHIGDYVDVASQSGTVTGIGLTYTKLQTADNKIVSIPNSAVVSAQIVNYTVSGTRRVSVTVRVPYDIPPETVRQALQEAAYIPTAIPEPEPYTAVSAFGESSAEYVLHIWARSDDYWTALHTLNEHILTVFREKDIPVAIPGMQVQLKERGSL